MHDPAELIQHLQALLLPHTGVVEARESRLDVGEKQHQVTHQQHQAESSHGKLRTSVCKTRVCQYITAKNECTNLCGLSEDEFRVFNQTLQWHSHVDDLCPLVFSAVVRHELAIPGVEDDETWFSSTTVLIKWRCDVNCLSSHSKYSCHIQPFTHTLTRRCLEKLGIEPQRY